MVSINSKFESEILKLFKYAFFGGMGVLSDVSLYAVLTLSGFPYQASNALGYFLGTAISFALNRKYTFKVKDKILIRVFKFFFVAFLGYLFSAFLLYIMVSHFFLSPILAKFITLIFVLVFQFTLNSKITFKEKR